MKANLVGLFALLILVALRTDFWFWQSTRLVVGLPVGLLYHIGFCGLVSAVMLILVHRFWPQHLEEPGEEGGA